ncbi:hypothetical protein OH77DRAFT_1408850, partial [Trametes cingulata]
MTGPATVIYQNLYDPSGPDPIPTEDGTLQIQYEDLIDPTFDVARWFRATLVDLYEGDLSDFQDHGSELMGDVRAAWTAEMLNLCEPWPEACLAAPGTATAARFSAFSHGSSVRVIDAYLELSAEFPLACFENPCFDLAGWYAVFADSRLGDPGTCLLDDLEGVLQPLFEPDLIQSDQYVVHANAARLGSPNTEPVQRNAAAPRDFRRVIPEPIVVVTMINDEPARTLLDSGSLADFVSSKFAHQLGIRVLELEKPLPVQLAVQGSRAKVNYGCKALIEYQEISEERYFDVMNLLNYDLILGTPFLCQHRVSLGFNPTSVLIGSVTALNVAGTQTRVIESRAAEVFEDRLESARRELREYAAPICQDASDAPFPPLRAINHTIPLKDPSKVYSWRPSRCPDALRDLWIEKRDAYLNS